MVRFIIKSLIMQINRRILFTFQYGQIYYYAAEMKEHNKKAIYIPIWLDLLLDGLMTAEDLTMIFTFQYGQIYYVKFNF